MSLIKVTAEDLHTLSTQVSTGSGQIQEQLGQLQGKVLGVVGGDWEGAASGQFHSLYEEWQRSAQHLNHALDNIAKLLQQAGTQYQHTEDAIRNSMA